METFKLGGSLEISRLGYGTMRLVNDGAWGEPADREASRKVVRRAVELGITFLDTADAYGPEIAEEILAEALLPYPKGVLIGTKGGITRQGPAKAAPVGRPEYLHQCVEMSLRRLKLEAIELYQLHRIDPQVPMEESLGKLKELQAAGKIVHIGLSEVDAAQIEQARKTVEIVSVQNKYNLFERKHEAVLQYCEANGIAFLPWYPIAAGKLAKEGSALDTFAKERNATAGQISLAWLLQHSPVMVPIPGTSSIAHLEENVKATEVKLTQGCLDELELIANTQAS